MSDLSVVLDERVRLLAAVLSISDWPEMEQAIMPHAVHFQSKLTRQFLAEYKSPPAVALVNQALADGCSLSELFHTALAGQWPTFKPLEPLPGRFADGELNRQLAGFLQGSGLTEEFWPSQQPAWDEAIADLRTIFTDNPLPEFIGHLVGRPLTKDVVIVPAIVYPLLASVVVETAETYTIIIPPPKAWGESPPWPFRDGFDWVLGECCRELTHHLLRDVLASASADQLSLFKHGIATLFLETTLTDDEGMAYLVRAKRQYNLPKLPMFVEQLRDYLHNQNRPPIHTLLGLDK